MAIQVIGYRVGSKFHQLPLVKDYGADELETLCEVLAEFAGVIIFHGGKDSRQILMSKCGHLFKEGRAAVLFIFTKGFLVPETVDTPFVHYHSRSIHSPCEDAQLGDAFKRLIERCGELDHLPSEHAISELWEVVDTSDYVDSMRRIRELEEVLLAGPSADGQIRAEYVGKVAGFLPGRVLTFRQLKDIYLAWCCGLKKKSDLNRWQSRREHLNHQIFHHGFYGLVARPSVIEALNRFGSREIPTLDSGIRGILARWPDTSAEFRDLLAQGNPAAISECDLMLALLCLTDSDSAAIIASYRARYGDQLEQALVQATRALDGVDNLVAEILSQLDGDAPRARGSSTDFGVQLASRCQRLSACVGSLRRLSSLGGGSHA